MPQPDDADDADEPRKPEQRRVLPQPRDERRADDDEVEDVPGIAEEVVGAAAVRGHAQRELGDEDAEEDLVQKVEEVTVLTGQALVGLQAEHDRVRQDDGENARREQR